MASVSGKVRVPEIEGLFTWPSDDPRLIGGRCRHCGTVSFPIQLARCYNPECGSTEIEEVKLSKRGKIWSYVIQYYKPPAPFVAPEPPYTVAFVELPEGIRIPGIMKTVEGVKIGMDVELNIEILRTDEEGKERVTFFWKPVK